MAAYVTQEDIFHPTSTVKEAVLFQANLRMHSKMPSHEKDALALQLIQDVGLKGKENTLVGGPLPGGLNLRGLSGGEKRRLSLCCSTITSPSLLFLDEPTSGLDGFAALVVCISSVLTPAPLSTSYSPLCSIFRPVHHFTSFICASIMEKSCQHDFALISSVVNAFFLEIFLIRQFINLTPTDNAFVENLLSGQ